MVCDPLPSWVKNRGGDTPLGNTSTLTRSTLMVLSPYRYNSHFSLRHLSFNLNREEVIVSANSVVVAEPAIQHANTPNNLLVLEIIEEVFSSYRLHTVPNRIVSTIRREEATTRRHRDANTPAAGQSADEEHEVTIVAVATMVEPFKGTVNDTTESSATGAVNSKIPLYFPLETGSARSILMVL